MSKEKAGLQIIGVGVHHHPRTGGHLVCQPNGPIAPKVKNIGAWIAERVVDDVSRGQMRGLRAPYVVSTPSPNRLTNLCVGDGMTVERDGVGLLVKVEEARYWGSL